jgi:molybdopterin molybdotransferase
MITVAEAEAIIKSSIKVFDGSQTDMVPLADSLDRVLAENIYPERSLPPFNRATMDGFAIKVEENKSAPLVFKIKDTVFSGQIKNIKTSFSECVEIMTGAPLPSDLNCVVPVEQTDTDQGTIQINKNYIPKVGQYIHKMGSDVDLRTRLLASGKKINVPDLLLLAASGKQKIKVKRLPRILLIITGDEIVPIGKNIESFQIRPASQYGIQGALNKQFLSELDIILIGDDPKLLETTLNNAIKSKDIIIFTGGVSMGKHDYVKDAISSSCDGPGFHKVLQKPGLPFMFSSKKNGHLIFGLPGNPVSSMVCLYRYVIPAIQWCIGEVSNRSCQMLALIEKVPCPHGLSYFLPVSLTSINGADLKAKPMPTNTSGDFITLGKSDGFLEISATNQSESTDKKYPFTPW